MYVSHLCFFFFFFFFFFNLLNTYIARLQLGINNTYTRASANISGRFSLKKKKRRHIVLKRSWKISVASQFVEKINNL